ncbi:MAG: hypothetical protein ACI9U2_004492, partial [Bradymonadia bacterium]
SAGLSWQPQRSATDSRIERCFMETFARGGWGYPSLDRRGRGVNDGVVNDGRRAAGQRARDSAGTWSVTVPPSGADATGMFGLRHVAKASVWWSQTYAQHRDAHAARTPAGRPLNWLVHHHTPCGWVVGPYHIGHPDRGRQADADRPRSAPTGPRSGPAERPRSGEHASSAVCVGGGAALSVPRLFCGPMAELASGTMRTHRA